MGERERSRKAVETVARRVVEHNRMIGKQTTFSEAQGQVAGLANRADQANEAGRQRLKPKPEGPKGPQVVRLVQRLKPEIPRSYVDMGRSKK